MRYRRSRALKPEEEQLWRRVAESTRPLHPRRGEQQEDPGASGETAQPSEPETDTPDRAAPISPFRIGQRANAGRAGHGPAASWPEQPPGGHSTIDRKAAKRLAQGKMAPEARIDLHGMTQDDAQSALIGFITTAHARGKRLALVITGKGRPADDPAGMPRQEGVLRRQVPMWLRAAPLRPLVQDIRQAHQRHGGSGAYYVYLRRTR